MWDPYDKSHDHALTPCFRQQLPDCSCPHLAEESTAVDGSEMGEVAIEVELLCHNSEASFLQGKEEITRAIAAAWQDQIRPERMTEMAWQVKLASTGG